MNADNEQFQMERVNDVAFRALTEQSIHIIRQNMDSINYERIGQLNVLTLRKKIPSK